MLLTLRTTHVPATDLGYLLHKNPQRPQAFELTFGREVFGTALAGRCQARPELAATVLPLEAHLPVVPCAGGEAFLHRLFAPLGYAITAVLHLIAGERLARRRLTVVDATSVSRTRAGRSSRSPAATTRTLRPPRAAVGRARLRVRRAGARERAGRPAAVRLADGP